MSETENSTQVPQRKKFWRVLTIVAVILILIVLGLNLALRTASEIAERIFCGTSISGLGGEMRMYSYNNGGQYPAASKWCDLIVEQYGTRPRRFYCPSSAEHQNPFAMNPNCEPNSPPDTVLLFETKGGWNQFGGAEILTTENHKGKGCNILFNDGHTKFVKPEEFDKLNWGDEPVEMRLGK